MPAPYDTLETVVNVARVRLNDAIAAIGGDVVTDSAAFTLVAINAAWRRFQDLCSNFGVEAFNREITFASVIATALPDNGNFVWFDWTGYNNGSLQSAPAFPNDLIYPLALEERISGGTGSLTPMDQCFNGLPTANKGPLNRTWEWRQEKIYMPGATGATDIRLRYAGYLNDFTSGSFSSQTVNLMRSLNPFAWYICAEIAKARGDVDAGAFEQLAIDATQQIYNRDVRQPRSLFKGSEMGKMPDQYTPTLGPAGPRGPQRG